MFNSMELGEIGEALEEALEHTAHCIGVTDEFEGHAAEIVIDVRDAERVVEELERRGYRIVRGAL